MIKTEHIKAVEARQKLEELAYHLSLAENELLNANNMVAHKKSDLQDAENAIEKSQKMFEESGKRIETNKMHIAALKKLLSENPDWQRLKDFAESEIAQLQRENRDLETNMYRIHQAIEARKQSVDKIKKELNSWQARLNKAQADVENLKAQIEKLKKRRYEVENVEA